MLIGIYGMVTQPKGQKCIEPIEDWSIFMEKCTPAVTPPLLIAYLSPKNEKAYFFILRSCIPTYRTVKGLGMLLLMHLKEPFSAYISLLVE